MKRLLAVLTFLLLLASSAFALSDSEYLKMKRNSGKFSKADTRLTQVWNKLKKQMNKKDFAKLQASQREWIESGRDDVAKEYIKEGYSKVEAYTMATNERADELPKIADKIKKSSSSNSSSKPKPKPKPKQPEPEIDVEEIEEDDNYGEIEEDRYKNTSSNAPEGNYSRNNRDHGGYMTVTVLDRESMEVEVTISLVNPEVTWTSRGWIDENNTLELFDKDYPSCQANLTFKNGKIDIETSDVDEWDEVLGEARLDGLYTKSR